MRLPSKVWVLGVVETKGIPTDRKGPQVTEKNQRVSTFPLRLPRSTRMLANDLAAREGLSLNHFISMAVAEKIARLEKFSWPHDAEQPPPSREA